MPLVSGRYKVLQAQVLCGLNPHCAEYEFQVLTQVPPQTCRETARLYFLPQHSWLEKQDPKHLHQTFFQLRKYSEWEDEEWRLPEWIHQILTNDILQEDYTKDTSATSSNWYTHTVSMANVLLHYMAREVKASHMMGRNYEEVWKKVLNELIDQWKHVEIQHQMYEIALGHMLHAMCLCIPKHSWVYLRWSCQPLFQKAYRRMKVGEYEMNHRGQMRLFADLALFVVNMTPYLGTNVYLHHLWYTTKEVRVLFERVYAQFKRNYLLQDPQLTMPDDVRYADLQHPMEVFTYRLYEWERKQESGRRAQGREPFVYLWEKDQEGTEEEGQEQDEETCARTAFLQENNAKWITYLKNNYQKHRDAMAESICPMGELRMEETLPVFLRSPDRESEEMMVRWLMKAVGCKRVVHKALQYLEYLPAGLWTPGYICKEIVQWAEIRPKLPIMCSVKRYNLHLWEKLREENYVFKWKQCPTDILPLLMGLTKEKPVLQAIMKCVTFQPIDTDTRKESLSMRLHRMHDLMKRVNVHHENFATVLFALLEPNYDTARGLETVIHLCSTFDDEKTIRGVAQRFVKRYRSRCRKEGWALEGERKRQKNDIFPARWWQNAPGFGFLRADHLLLIGESFTQCLCRQALHRTCVLFFDEWKEQGLRMCFAYDEIYPPYTRMVWSEEIMPRASTKGSEARLLLLRHHTLVTGRRERTCLSLEQYLRREEPEVERKGERKRAEAAKKERGGGGGDSERKRRRTRERNENDAVARKDP
uniref:Uncharacterized protein n=1 Tax=Palpitomonas bilix TaxID=652834 RepID=A0A7S3D300_9EUKA|mmetsp:Transcript_18074/g.44947  ORF Transcript_18074/g.44947 Transcript_18074/m.44947 type:complete len:760 (+) Transcript_18074:5758-8037(+)|eukprot:CAMPEP_0113916088 /NCGR_PEP_ID=MMETSP0780_2-20120614/31789_1 /TAXON_ID=652834 /ORGANISM="Palpitomonas bilix" /LENGTH=759 /DNA_ID=CAMNT_0000915121 /DNA_START=84 /DNA_END=2363 /DNA_ORIENTATION=+ /assembly_acc=CAM_ASM_000599